MGLGGISIWELLIILAIVVLIFGTKKLRNMGGDLGAAIHNFRKSMKEGEQDAEQKRNELAKPGLPEQKPDDSK
ncbi:MAG TPA: Sec-independent protein translocase subunit TatA [Nevskiales bacterium]|nr:Sec-independent protein translocase subunit TatA [Nevskiales bacterium]